MDDLHPANAEELANIAQEDTDDCSADLWERYPPNPGHVTLD